ncbi:MAG: serine/threonine-protein kinase [Persicimonas sp.]
MPDDASIPHVLQSGEVLLDRYVVGEPIAEGGMAAVRRGRDRQNSRPVALKVLYPHYEENETVRTRFIDEGRIQSLLSHPNIVEVYDIVRRPALAIVMEFVDGPTLDDYLDAQGPLGVDQILDVMLPVLSAIGFAHSQGVIHRDIKPSNVLLEPTDHGLVPKIMDFGVAKFDRDEELTEAGTTVGTLHYMSPEQILGADDIDGRADIYSLGVTIYKLCTGELPFNASTEFTLMMAQVEAEPTPPGEVFEEVAPELEEVVLRALEKEPERRFQSVRDLTSALLALRESLYEYAETDTDTAPIPRDLIAYAMEADEVAVDRTGELPMDAIEKAARMLAEGSEAGLDTTLELAAERIEASVRQDRKRAQTEPIEERDVGNSTTATAERLPAEEVPTDTREEVESGDTDHDKPLSEETTRPYHKDDLERAPTDPLAGASEPATDPLELAETNEESSEKIDKPEDNSAKAPRDEYNSEEPGAIEKRSRAFWLALIGAVAVVVAVGLSLLIF